MIRTNFKKYGEYRWDFVKGEEYQHDCYFIFNEQMMADFLNCKIEDSDACLALELRTVDYDEHYNAKGQDTVKMINPTYHLEMWGYDECAVYSANNLNHIKAVAKKYIEKLIKLIDSKKYSWEAYWQICMEMHHENEAREEKERKAKIKKDQDRRMKNFMSFIKS